MQRTILALLALVMFGSPIALAATEVTVWGWRGDAELWEAVEEWLQEAGHDITINYEQTRATEYDAKMSLALQGGEGPDIVYTRRLPGQRTQGLIDAGLIVPLGDELSFEHFTDVTLSFIQSDSQTWGVPFANQIIGVFYNKDIFEEYGLEEPTTWEQLVSHAQTLQDNGVTPFFIAGRDAWTLAMQHAMTGVSTPGPEWIEKLQAGEVNLLDPEFVAINSRLNDLKPFYQQDFMANSADDQDASFAFGEAAMVFYGVWGVQQWQELNPEMNVGYFMVPTVSASTEPYAYVYMDGSFALNANADHPDAALTVLEFVTTPEFGTMFANVTGELPAVTGAELPEDRLILQEVAEIAEQRAAPYAYWVGSPLVTGTPSLYDILSSGMQEMYLGDISPEQLAEQAQEGVSSWFEPLQ